MIAGDDPLTARVLEHAERMRIISKWGVGTDGIDSEAARERGIRVTNTPGVFGDEVADVALGYVVMLARQLHRIDASVKAGGWFKHEGRSLAGKTLGHRRVRQHRPGRRPARDGLRHAGRRARRRRMSRRAAADDWGSSSWTRDELFARSDVLVLCCPLTAGDASPGRRARRSR